ncbi:MAG: transketolase [Planctomycetes bacterium]|nr:transketolase [Planctomycetota bacterium]
MALRPERKRELEALCRRFRVDVIDTLHAIQTGHPGGSLSVCEILTALYFEKARVDPANPDWPDRDRIVIGKGHASPMLYRVMAERGFFPVEEMRTLRQLDSRLQGHPCPLDCPGVESASGPLGIALPAALGMALGLRLEGRPSFVYAIIGDGESNEGVVWEACMAANKFKPDNLIIILDKNGVQLDGPTEVIMPGLDMAKKFAAFGLHVQECDGHDLDALCDAIDRAKAATGTASVIIANTVKGKGVSFMEGQHLWHGKTITDDERRQALLDLGEPA